MSVVQEQPRFEWASMMVFDCAQCQMLTPEFIEDESNKLFDMAWAPAVGALPEVWNVPVGYKSLDDPKLVHFTQGIPAFFEVQGCPEDIEWHQAKRVMLHTVPWKELMGKSIHAKPVLERLVSRYA